MSELAPNLKKGEAIFLNECHQHYRLSFKKTKIYEKDDMVRHDRNELKI